MGEEAGDDLDRHAPADELGGVGVAQHVGGELDAGPGPQHGHQLVDGGVAQRVAAPAAPQVDEHVVGVAPAVLGVHVVGVQAHQGGRDRDHRSGRHLGPGAVGVVGAGDDVQLASATHEVGVAKAQGLAHPHARLGQEGEQEPIALVLAGGQDRHHLVGGQAAGQAPVDRQLDGPGADSLALGGVVEERLVGATAHPAPGDEVGGEGHAGAGVVLVEPEHPGEVAVHRRRRAHTDAVVQHDDVARR